MKFSFWVLFFLLLPSIVYIGNDQFDTGLLKISVIELICCTYYVFMLFQFASITATMLKKCMILLNDLNVNFQV